MARPKKIASFQTWNDLPLGIIQQRHPFYVLDATRTPQVTTGTGKYPGYGLSVNRAPSATTAAAMRVRFPSTGILNNGSGSANANKALFQWAGWVRFNTVANTLAAQPVIGIGSSATAATVFSSIIGILNNTTNGLNLLFPTNLSAIGTSPIMVAIQLGVYYWIDVRLYCDNTAVAADRVKATYRISGATVADNVSVTLIAGTSPNNVTDSWLPFSSTSFDYSLSVQTMSAVSGADADWPPGFTTGTANSAVSGANTLPEMKPQQFGKLTADADGSIIQWQSSAPGVDNYVAATNGTDFVQALQSDETDLYKFVPPVGVTLANVNAVKYRLQTNKYMSVLPSMKDTAADPLQTGNGVVDRGIGALSMIVEQGKDDTAWTDASIRAAEFGQTSV
ncbi:hypothetical protein [Achromobacter phage Motura]|uniref:Uncharacterized protein n=1 Tax=Achromobacter phage Motura TaxID=2591403 RepID=A0A514CTB7_9CAUD|nr:hypothetical protein H1O15_gp122 [Achromobacter phage Motura]QDH83706.1 hypothetical protein [Achromobacter phage Motura]